MTYTHFANVVEGGMTRKASFPILTLMLVVFQRSPQAQRGERLKLAVGPERIILPGYLQPFLFQSAGGTLILQAQMPFPRGYMPPPMNAYLGIPGTIGSIDGGRTW
jgi:hypothetical protein